MATNPQIAQGTLNRVRASVVIPNYPTLNINSSHMGRDLLSLEFDEDFSEQIPTATGIVNSPAPYVMATCSINLLRSQALANAWIQQVETYALIGRIVIHSDTSAFPKRHVHNCSVLKANPGRMDGLNPTVDLVIRGVFYVNNNLWNLV